MRLFSSYGCGEEEESRGEPEGLGLRFAAFMGDAVITR
jgi:hypothetical protein